MGTKAQGDMCYAAAMPEEPMFVLLARDPYAPQLVRYWAQGRENAIEAGLKPVEDMAKVEEAYACADKMEAWREANNGAWRNTEYKCGVSEPSERDRALEEAAKVCEGVTHTGRWAPTKLEIAVSTQNFCAKAIRAQKSGEA